MKKKIPFIIVYILAFAVTFVNVFFSIKTSLFSDINDLPIGECINSVKSPDDKSILNIYLIENNLGVAIRGELLRNNIKTNVFWQTGINTTDAVWENEKVVNINGVSLDVIDGGYYDCRRGVSLFQEGALEGEEAANE